MKDERVIVIGGTSGIGLSVVENFIKKGAKVIVAARNQEKLRIVKERFDGVETYQLDGSNEDEVKAFFSKVGEFDHLVTTLGSHYFSPVADSDTASYLELLNSKQLGQYLAVKHAAQSISKNGSITLFSGTVTQKPMSGASFYASVGGATEAAAKSWALELAPIRVNVVVPGIIHTPAWDGLIPDEKIKLEQLDAIASTLPVKRVGTSEDIADAVSFLVGNTFVNGLSLVIDGGHRLI
jgi:NAD(P)-dependent dehydrogenase (short-subunit alcohol dehydrogenase family)